MYFLGQVCCLDLQKIGHIVTTVLLCNLNYQQDQRKLPQPESPCASLSLLFCNNLKFPNQPLPLK